MRRRLVEKHGEVDLDEAWLCHVAKSYVDQQHHAFAPSTSAVVLILRPPYSVSSRMRSTGEGLVTSIMTASGAAPMAQILPEHLESWQQDRNHAEAEQIEVTRRPVRIVHLTCDQDGAFEGEPASVRAYAQAVKKPFKRVTRQQYAVCAWLGGNLATTCGCRPRPPFPTI